MSFGVVFRVGFVCIYPADAKGLVFSFLRVEEREAGRRE